MESLIITPADNEELALIKAVLKKMNLKIKVLSDEEKENMGLALLNEPSRPQQDYPPRRGDEKAG